MECTIVSLGIGKDVEAEKSMRAAMPNCEFWGADPVLETNADIFPEVGKFYNIAVGAENGTFRSCTSERHLQMNIEVHRPNAEQLKQFFDFYQQLMEEKQWTLMSASSIIGHL
ncbi:hypothetical protein OSTOST_22718, partial [Ostertagia ostertagi]